jgi:hypothetical protein
MEPTVLIPIAGALASLLPVLARAIASWLARNEELVRLLKRLGIDLTSSAIQRDTTETFEDRIRQLGSALQASAATIDEIQAEIERRQSVVAKLEEDARRYEELARLNRAEAEAVAQLVEGKLKQGERRSLWSNFAMNFFFFLLGAGVSYFLAQIST